MSTTPESNPTYPQTTRCSQRPPHNSQQSPAGEGYSFDFVGENAMKQHRIPEAVLRDDMIVPSDKLDEAASILLENGFRHSTGNILMLRAPFWRRGWNNVAKICRRLKYSLSFELEYDDNYFELLLLPTTIVRWDLEPLNDQKKFVRIAENIFCLSAHVMAASIAPTFIHHPEGAKSAFGSFMISWASYYRYYAGFGLEMLDGYAEKELEEWWHTPLPSAKDDVKIYSNIWIYIL